jgi:hypothetical protein
VIGADIMRSGLEICYERYRVSGLVLDANTKESFGLPLGSNSTNSIQSYFPHNTLLDALCCPSLNLWKEFHRVLKSNGEVNIFIDMFRYVPVQMNRAENGDGVIITQPLKKIAGAAIASGFKVESKELSRGELRDINTRVTENILRHSPLEARGIIVHHVHGKKVNL